MRLYKQITKRQAGVIYRAHKENKIEITDEEIKKVYNLVDYDGYDDGKHMQQMNDRLDAAIEKIFDGDYEEANAQLAMAFGRLHEYNEEHEEEREEEKAYAIIYDDDEDDDIPLDDLHMEITGEMIEELNELNEGGALTFMIAEITGDHITKRMNAEEAKALVA